MKPNQSLEMHVERDQQVWDACAETYEKHIVQGHPNIIAYEDFEEDFLDQLLREVATTQNLPITMMDIGCGSGRLHLRYGIKTLPHEFHSDNPALQAIIHTNSKYAHDSIISKGLKEVWGIDFSARMIELAQQKIDETIPISGRTIQITLKQGSAFDLEPWGKATLPMAICLVNSIGVMQGPAGAQALFKSMRRAVEQSGGIAIISNFQKAYVPTYALGQYESTLDVSGQPRWLTPTTYASEEYIQRAREYKWAHYSDPSLLVDVTDRNGKLVAKDHQLTRDPELTENICQSGHIQTYTDYESYWYGFDQMDRWIKEYWVNAGVTYHIHTKDLDTLRGEPGQFSILDAGNHLARLIQRWRA